MDISKRMIGRRPEGLSLGANGALIPVSCGSAVGRRVRDGLNLMEYKNKFK